MVTPAADYQAPQALTSAELLMMRREAKPTLCQSALLYSLLYGAKLRLSNGRAERDDVRAVNIVI